MNVAKILILTLSLPILLFAEIDGKQQYEMLCGACHGSNGRGASKDFPPLAGSEWVKGSPDRLVQIILHGLTGPVEVKGKAFNLVMPPQGAALTDAQIAAISSYVRKAWGNKSSEISELQVAAMRKQTDERQEMWTSKELISQWPLTQNSGPINGLVAYLYKGEFETMPDFSKLKADAVEEEASGLMNPNQAGLTNNFAMVWEGKFTVPKDEQYKFHLQSDDGARVFVNGKQVTEIAGLGPLSRTAIGKVRLKKGDADLRVEYFQKVGNIGLILQWGIGKKMNSLTSQPVTTQGTVKPSNPILLVVEDEARIYQNFIEGSSPRSIGVGLPGAVNYTFSIDELGVGLVWSGDFIDAGLHWHGRGKGYQKPAGSSVISLGGKPAFAIWKPGNSWPNQFSSGLSYRYLGYRLDAKRQPTFRYQIGGVDFAESCSKSEANGLNRRIAIGAGKLPNGLTLRLAGAGATSRNHTSANLAGGMQLQLRTSGKLITNDQGVYLAIKPKQDLQTILLNYTWK